jgi:chromate transporter
VNLLHLLFGFFTANVLGYGGGPSSIPLMQDQIVNHYHWMTNAQFANALALANALPGPIATKIAAFVGYSVGGLGGVVVALLATIVPSALAMIALLRLFHRYRQSSVVRGMTILVQPVIAILMVVLTWQIGAESVGHIGYIQFFAIALVAVIAMQKFKIHPALVIVASCLYGGFVIR